MKICMAISSASRRRGWINEEGDDEALLHQLQRLMQERVMRAPLAEPAALHGVGPRVEEAGAGLIPLFAYFGPYEDMRLKKP